MVLQLASSSFARALPLALLFTACGEEPGTVTADFTLPDASPPEAGCTEGASQSCPCPGSDAPGNQYCYGGSWLLCSCSVPYVPPDLTSTGSCLPGLYAGNFFGIYFSSYNFAGIPIPVVGADLSGAPPLTLTLEEKATSGGLEFNTYEVRDGYVKGVADGVFPFEGKLTGTLDCATKTFSGELDGWYALAIDLGIDLNRGYFKGPVSGVYDAVTHEFKLGTWDVDEYKGNPVAGYGIVLTELGGGGEWDAKYQGAEQSDAGLPDASSYDAGP